MSTTTICQNVIYGLGEGAMVSDATMLTYALRWCNQAYRDIFLRYRFKSLRTKGIFRTTKGQATYQAPDGFMGFLTLKDESNATIINQVTSEEYSRVVDCTKVTGESFTSSSDVAVSLDYSGIQQYSETVTNAAGTTTYTRNSDYAMDYVAGTITMLSTGSMADATAYSIDYLYHTSGKPTDFCVDFDENTGLFLFRLTPTPDATYVGSLLYADVPTPLTSAVNPIWDKFEFCLERGGIYYGSLEITLDPNKRQEFRGLYEAQIQALIQLDNELNTKHQPIKIVMRKLDYY